MLFQNAIGIAESAKSTTKMDKVVDNVLDFIDGVVETLTSIDNAFTRMLQARGISVKGISDSLLRKSKSMKNTARAWKDKAVDSLFGNKSVIDLNADNVAADDLTKSMQFKTSGLEPPPAEQTNQGSMAGILTQKPANAFTNAVEHEQSEEARKLDTLIELQRAALSSQEDSLALKAAELFGGDSTSSTLEVMKRATGGKKHGLIRTSVGVVGSVSKFLFGSAFRTMYGRKQEVLDEKSGRIGLKRKGGIFGMLGSVAKFAIPALFSLVGAAVPLLGTIAGAIPALGTMLVGSLLKGPLSLLGGITSALGKLGLSIITGLGRVIGSIMGVETADILTDMGRDGKPKKGSPKSRGRVKGKGGRVGRTLGRGARGVGRGIKGVGRGLGSILKFQLVMSAFDSLFSKDGWLRKVAGGTVDTVKNAGGSIVNAVKGAGQSVANTATGVWNGAKAVGGKVLNTAKNAGGSIVNAAKGIGESVSTKASTVWGGVKAVGQKTGISKVLGSIGGGIATAGRWLGGPTGRGVLFKGLRAVGSVAGKAVGFFFTGPVGWVVGVGSLLYDGYSLYKYFTGDETGETATSTPVLITQLRMMGYGIPISQSTHYPKVFEIEEVAGRGLLRNPTTKDLNFTMPDDGQHLDDLMNVLGVTGEDPYYDERILKWFKFRFLPVYLNFMRALWNRNETKKAGQIDQLTLNDQLNLVTSHQASAEVFGLRELPFVSYQESEVTKTEYEEFRTFTIHQIEKGGGTVDFKSGEITSKIKANGEKMRSHVFGSSTDKTDFSFLNNPALSKFGDKLGGGLFGAAGAVNNINDTFNTNNIKGSTEIGNGDGSTIEGLDPDNISIPQAIESAAAMTGMPADILYTLFKMESQLIPGANADTSNAVGLGQFIPSTWKTMLARYGEKYGIPPDAKRTNPLYNAILSAEYMKENYAATKDMAEDIGMEPALAIYFGHFLGTSGVQKYLRALKANPNTPMEDVVSQAAIRANSSVMAGKTVGQFYELYKTRYSTHLNTPATQYRGIKEHAKQFPKLYEGITINDRAPSGKNQGPLTTLQKEHQMPIIGAGGVLAAINDHSMKANGTAQGALLDLGSAQGISGSVGNTIPTALPSSTNYVTPTDQKTGSISWSGEDFSAKYTGKVGGVVVHPIIEGYPYYVTSLFGPRNTGIPGASLDHGGIDYGVPSRKAGTPIVATGDGTVWRSYSSKSYGEVVYITHPDGLQTRYAHLQKRNVKEGQKVKAGEVVGLMGNTGVGSGVHLHFEVRRGHGQDSQKLDPFEFPVIRDAYLGHRQVTVNGPPNAAGAGVEEAVESIEGQTQGANEPPPEDELNTPTEYGMQSMDMGFGAAKLVAGGALNATPTTHRGPSSISEAPKSRVMDSARDAAMESASTKQDINVSVETTNLEAINSETNTLLKSLIALMGKMDTNMADTLGEAVSNINVSPNNVESTANNNKQRVGGGVRDFRGMGAGQSAMSLSTKSYT